MSKKTNSEVGNVVRDYLQQQNRPYSLVDIFNNLHNKHGKTAVQKALDQLVNDKQICEKSYGKQKVYVINQDLMPVISDSELKSMDSKINDLNIELTKCNKQLKDFESELQQLQSTLTTEEAELQVKNLEKEIQVYTSKLSNLTSNPNLISQEEKAAIQVGRDKQMKEWRKRKRCADDMLNAVLEGYPKGKKVLYEEIGVETDDDVGVKIPT